MTSRNARRVTHDDLYSEVRAILAAVGERLGVPVHDAELLRLHSNASFALPSAGLVVRIATNPDALPHVRASLAITRWLARRGFPCVVPADVDGQPLVEGGRVVSVWRYTPTATGPRASGAELGGLLRDLHTQPEPPHQLGRFSNPFASVAKALEEAPGATPDADRSWLSDRITALRGQWSAMNFPRPPGLIHGDAHVGNVMRTTSDKVVLGDWDHVATGPREWDLVQIHFMRRRFGRATAEDIEAFAASYGWDARAWPGLDVLIAIREITGLSPYIRTAPAKPFSRHQLAYRLDTLRHNDTAARWQSPPAE
ncbi:MAG TPA: phosphotransferase [Streptosporangiaceae bacterium]|nr:phosphotransferase [Streptosporangiaceae bacterium]